MAVHAAAGAFLEGPAATAAAVARQLAGLAPLGIDGVPLAVAIAPGGAIPLLACWLLRRAAPGPAAWGFAASVALLALVLVPAGAIHHMMTAMAGLEGPGPAATALWCAKGGAIASLPAWLVWGWAVFARERFGMTGGYIAGSAGLLILAWLVLAAAQVR